MDIVFYIILPVQLKDKNQNLLDFIKYYINYENIFILLLIFILFFN